MLAYKLFGKNKKPNVKSDHFVGDYYVLYAKKKNKELEREAQELLVKWEEGDKETTNLWKKMNKWALDGIKETYSNLGFKVDKTYYESEHYKEGKKIVMDGLKRGIFHKDKKGAVVVNLGKELDEKVLLRDDGTSVYVTQDLSLAVKRYKDYKMDKMIYVVGNEQIYHFRVLFSVLEKLNIKFAKNCFHLAYGMVNLPEGKMKSREGNVVDSDDLIDELTAMASEEIIKREKNLSKKHIQTRARAIAMASLRYYYLKVDHVKDVTFKPEESIKFEGNTGPYLLYTYARARSILRKAKYKKSSNLFISELSDSESLLISQLSNPTA